jgi:hypothetical protein
MRLIHSTAGARPAPTIVCRTSEFVTTANNTAELMWVKESENEVNNARSGLDPELRM